MNTATPAALRHQCSSESRLLVLSARLDMACTPVILEYVDTAVVALVGDEDHCYEVTTNGSALQNDLVTYNLCNYNTTAKRYLSGNILHSVRGSHLSGK